MSCARFCGILLLQARLNISLNLKHFTNCSMDSEKKRSCEVQLIMLIDEIAKTMQIGKQTDIILLDLAKLLIKFPRAKNPS